MNYDTALRTYPFKRIEEIESADILVGIPCYKNEKTIEHVIRMVTRGLVEHYGGKRSVILVASFVRQSWEMTSRKAETLVEEQALRFEKGKSYLIEEWYRKSSKKAKSTTLHSL